MSLYGHPGWLSENSDGVEEERTEFRKVLEEFCMGELLAKEQFQE